MSWEDRIREAAYTSPGGTRIVFQHEGVARETSKRTSAFEFVGVDDPYVQDSGRGPQAYPLRCYFEGADHDIDATQFELALLERGVGRLEHPFYGTFDVVPMGSVSRRDDLQGAANQSVVEVTFSRSLSAVYPRVSANLGADVLEAMADFDREAAEGFAGDVDADGVAEQAALGAAAKKNLTSFGADLADALEDASEGLQTFRSEVARASARVDDVLNVPTDLASELLAVMALPASLDASIDARLEGYGAFGERFLQATVQALLDLGPLPRQIVAAANAHHLSRLYASAAVGGAIRSAVQTTFTTRPEALRAAETLLERRDALVSWADTEREALVGAGAAGPDTGAAYEALNRAANTAAGYLVEISFALVPERRVVLDRARTALDLTAELYGDLDQLDFLIRTNDLSGSEILELQRGREILYYPGANA